MSNFIILGSKSDDGDSSKLKTDFTLFFSMTIPLRIFMDENVKGKEMKKKFPSKYLFFFLAYYYSKVTVQIP